MDTAPATANRPVEPCVVQHARDLNATVREWLQRIFGRALRDDEDVTILLTTPHAAPTSTDRKAVAKRLERVLDQAAANMESVSQAEFDKALDEAMLAVRPTGTYTIPMCFRIARRTGFAYSPTWSCLDSSGM